MFVEYITLTHYNVKLQGIYKNNLSEQNWDYHDSYYHLLLTKSNLLFAIYRCWLSSFNLRPEFNNAVDNIVCNASFSNDDLTLQLIKRNVSANIRLSLWLAFKVSELIFLYKIWSFFSCIKIEIFKQFWMLESFCVNITLPLSISNNIVIS